MERESKVTKTSAATKEAIVNASVRNIAAKPSLTATELQQKFVLPVVNPNGSSAIGELDRVVDETEAALDELETAITELQEAESPRTDAETARQSAESTRVSNEEARQSAEGAAGTFDESGEVVMAGSGRVYAEQQRTYAELARQALIPSAATTENKLVDKAYVDTNDALKLDKAGGTVSGNLTITGNLTVSGETTKVDTQSLSVKDNTIVANSEGENIADVAGFAIVTDSNGTAYGIMYSPTGDSVKIGQGTVDSDGEFTYGAGEAQDLATRGTFTDGHIPKWDGTDNTFKDTGETASALVKALTASSVNLWSLNEGCYRVVDGAIMVNYAPNLTCAFIIGDALIYIGSNPGGKTYMIFWGTKIVFGYTSSDTTVATTETRSIFNIPKNVVTVTNTAIAASDWVADSTYSMYAYRAAIPIAGTTTDKVANVVFGVTEAISGKYAPVCETYSGGVYIYSKQNTAITVPTIMLFGG